MGLGRVSGPPPAWAMEFNPANANQSRPQHTQAPMLAPSVGSKDPSMQVRPPQGSSHRNNYVSLYCAFNPLPFVQSGALTLVNSWKWPHRPRGRKALILSWHKAQTETLAG